MKEFFDTSVLVAAFWGGHTHHDASIRRLAAATKKRSACGAHSLAEVYATMTALPVRPLISPEQGLLFVEEISRRLTVISLTVNEYADTIRKAAGQGCSSGRIYDALLLRCALKAKAETIYTWNLKHYLALAPEWANRIKTPA